MGLLHQECLECRRTLSNIPRPQLFTKPMIDYNSIIKHAGPPSPSTSYGIKSESGLPGNGPSAATPTTSLGLTSGVKNSLKTFVKDENYYIRRKNNNIAAKKCRQLKKIRSLEMEKIALNLEHENAKLRKEAERLTAELVRIRGKLQKLKRN